jgi:O-antigen/teichoic acid export membrane protein
MDFRTLRLVHSAALILTVVSGIALALVGAGAYALVISSNVLHGVPFGYYLLAMEGWRPPQKWWMWPDWRAYRASLRFGAMQSGSAVFMAMRGILETLIIPPTLGYEALGLLNRAQVLFSTTIGRATTLVIETVYPMLPRSAPDREQFARHATLFVQAMLLISIPGALFVGMEGPVLSRVLYGSKWIAADPLIWPGTVFGWGVSTVFVFAAVLQSGNRLRLAFLSSVVTSAVALPAIAVAAAGGNTVHYAWSLAAGQTVAVFVVASMAASSLQNDWFRRTCWPPIAAAITAGGILLLLRTRNVGLGTIVTLCEETIAFGATVLIIMRFLFAEQLRQIILRMPLHSRLLRILRLG